MKKNLRFTFLAAIALIFSLIALPANNVSAAFADGTYDINYEIKEAGGGSTSIADGYFTKPAKLTVKDGAQSIQLTVTSADMIKSLSIGGSPVQVVSDSGDTRVVKFSASNLSNPINMKMHIVVPDLYDTEHGAQAVFDVSSVPAKSSEKTEAKEDEKTTEAPAPSKDDGSNNDSSKGESTEEVVNPPTGDDTPIALYLGLLIGSILVFALYKFRFARN